MPKYFATKEEIQASMFCIRNNFRISPVGIYGEKNKWRISVNIGPYKKGEKQNISPQVYDQHSIWPEYYRICKYYFIKYENKLL